MTVDACLRSFSRQIEAILKRALLVWKNQEGFFVGFVFFLVDRDGNSLCHTFAYVALFGPWCFLATCSFDGFG